MANHAGLAEREGDEDADRVEGNQVRYAGLEHDDEQHRQTGQHNNPGAEGKPLTPVEKLPGHVAVPSQDARKAGKIGEGRVRGQYQNEGGRDLDEVVVEASTADEERS